MTSEPRPSQETSKAFPTISRGVAPGLHHRLKKRKRERETEREMETEREGEGEGEGEGGRGRGRESNAGRQMQETDRPRLRFAGACHAECCPSLLNPDSMYSDVLHVSCMPSGPYFSNGIFTFLNGGRFWVADCGSPTATEAKSHLAVNRRCFAGNCSEGGMQRTRRRWSTQCCSACGESHATGGTEFSATEICGTS